MDRFEKLIDLGLNTEEATLITTTVSSLTMDEVKAGFFILDKRINRVRDLNKDFIPPGGIHTIVSNSFDAFQNPCNTDVIITSEHQRKDEMKRHGCIDAREFIPHGKTSLLD